MPAKVSVDKIKANLLQPALTSHFEVLIPRPSGLDDGYLNANGLPGFSDKQSKLNLLCSEATLPGSSLATHENNSDFTGVTEKFAYRRLYDDRIDFTFYVDAENYLPIKYFESWIKFIVGESKSADSRSGKLEINTQPKSKGVTYFIINLNATGIFISAPLVSSSQPLLIPKTQENKITSKKANATKLTVPAQ